EEPEGAAALPSAKAATMPMISVTPNAPRKNHTPVRSGRSASTSANTVNESVVGDSIAASAVSPSSTSTDVFKGVSARGPRRYRGRGGCCRGLSLRLLGRRGWLLRAKHGGTAPREAEGRQ